ncbi:MAG: S8 family serine peptidase, partial [bacterium]
MNQTKLSRAIKMGIAFPLLFSLSFGILVIDRAGAQPSSNHNFQSSRRGDKVSPDLRGQVHRSQRRGTQDNELISVILQLNGPPSARLSALLRRNGVRVKRLFQNFNSQAVELPAGVVDELAAFSELQTVSLDAEVKSFGHVSATTGADMVRADNGVPGSGLDGTGIGIAVLDSGMDTGHVSFLDKYGLRRIAFSKDFTGQNRVDDPFGHGTHVASIAAGNGRIGQAAYLGIAPNAKILNLRVLNSQGSGSTSAVLNALDWVMTNRALYNIRIVNMSLGTPALQSYRYDPVCLAVRRLTDAGILVVIAAGNTGKDNMGRKIYGAIHSPGIEPSALTVGAS